MSKSYIPSAPIDNTALIADIVGQINTNTNAKATATQNIVIADNDITQGQLGAMTVVDGQLDGNVMAINEHTDAQLALLSLSPVKSVQRGKIQVAGAQTITISAVEPSKSFLSFNEGYSYMELISNTQLLLTSTSGSRVMAWELIEYV